MSVLRDYQLTGLDKARDAYGSGKRAVCMVAPTGSGKTIMLAEAASGHKGRTVILVHRTELIEQTIAKLELAGVKPGALKAEYSFNLDAKVLVCSIQTLLARRARPEASLLVLDECHHFLAEEWSSVARHYKTVPVLGFTATPMRADGTALGNIFDAMVVVATNGELVRQGHLVPCEVYGPPKRLSGTQTLDPVELYQAHGRELPFVCFAADRDSGRVLAQRFGVPYVDGDTRNRGEVLRDLGKGVVNVYVLTEGWDCPRMAVCILARGCSSPSTYLQMVGRVRRPFEGKTKAIVLDCKGSVWLHGLPDSERVYSLDGDAIKVAGEAALRQCERCAAVFEVAGPCPRCGYASPLESPRYVSGAAVRIDLVTPEPRKRAFLQAQLAKGERLGRKRGWAIHIFRARFGHWPPPQWLKR